MGKVKTYEYDENKGCVIEKTHKNTRTLIGDRWILDRMFDTGTHGWNALRVGYMGIGASTNPNSGLPVGPSVSGDVPLTGTWKGASYNDWTLSSPKMLAAVETKRNGQTVSIIGTFSNAQFVAAGWFGTSNIADVMEMGLFLGSSFPAGSPLEVVAQEPNAMVVRATFTKQQGSAYTIDPYYKNNNGKSLPIVYEYGLEV